MTDFKLGDKVVFKDSDGWGQHWSEKGMKGVVVGLKGNSIPDNIMVEATTKAGAVIVAEFHPHRWELDKVSVKVMTVSVAHQIAASDADVAERQAQYEIDVEAVEAHIKRMRETLEEQRQQLAARMEEHAALLAEYGVEDI